MLGCTVPTAANYNPAATEDDGSCIYLNKIAGQCYEFTEVPGDTLIDNSFTLSMSINKNTLQPEGWVFYHDYFPDLYIHTRDKLFNLKNNRGYHNNEGPRGVYHDSTIVRPFFIDILFAGKQNMILNAINWTTEVRAPNNDEQANDQPALFDETLTAITIWNNYQTTGRILLDQGMLSLENSNNRNSEQSWNFNDFRDVMDHLNEQFIADLFHDFAIDPTKLNYDLPWFEKRLMEGNYFIVRFEFDNNNNKQININNLDIDTSNSYR